MEKIKTLLINAWCWIKDVAYLMLCLPIGLWVIIRHKELRDAIRAIGNREHIDLVNVVENVYSEDD